jgi:hypothetical protein
VPWVVGEFSDRVGQELSPKLRGLAMPSACRAFLT